MGAGRREAGIAWAAAALGVLEAFLPGAARAEETTIPTAPIPRDLAEEATLHVPRVGRLEGGVRALAFSQDGRWLVAGGVDGSVYAFDMERAAARPAGTGAASAPGIDGPNGAPDAAIHGPLFRHQGAVAGVSVLGEGARVLVVSAGDDGVVAWTTCPPPKAGRASPGGVTAGAAAPGLETPGAAPGAWPDVVTASAGLGPITALALDGPLTYEVAAGPSPTHRAIVGTASGAVASLGPRDLPAPAWHVVGAHRGAVAALVSLGGERFASAGQDGVVRTASASTGKEQKRAQVSKLELTSLATLPSGKVLAVGGWERGVRLLDALSLKPLRAPLEVHKGMTQALAIVPVAASAPAGGASGKPRPASNGGVPTSLLLASACIADEVTALTEAPLSGAKDASGAQVSSAPPSKRVKPFGVAAALAASPDGSRLAAGTFSGDIVLYRVGGHP